MWARGLDQPSVCSSEKIFRRKRRNMRGRRSARDATTRYMHSIRGLPQLLFFVPFEEGDRNAVRVVQLERFAPHETDCGLGVSIPNLRCTPVMSSTFITT